LGTFKEQNGQTFIKKNMLATFGEEDISTDRPAKYSVHNFLPAKEQE
jgi:hypothetical protein